MYFLHMLLRKPTDGGEWCLFSESSLTAPEYRQQMPHTNFLETFAHRHDDLFVFLLNALCEVN